MRRSVKIGIWSLVGVLTVSGGLALASTLYFNSKNNNNTSNNQKPGGDSNTPDNNTPINPPSNGDDNNSNSGNNNDTNKPSTPDKPNVPETKPEQPKPPANPDKPTNPDKPVEPNNPPSNGNDNNNTTGQTIQTKFKLDEVFDKYDYVKKTTDYQDYFKNNKLAFDESKIKIITYSVFRPMIIKAMNLDLTKNTLKINIFYRLNEDNTEVKLQVKWGIISNNSLISLEKKYYDNIYIKLR